MQIGGIDSPVIKNPINNMPYLPGSSLKGKTRSLLESYLGLVHKEKKSKNGEETEVPSGKIPGIRVLPINDKYAHWKRNLVAVVFGHLDHKSHQTLPTRIIFRDSVIVGVIENDSLVSENNIIRNLQMIIDRMSSVFSEAKTEVSIDRLTGSTGDIGKPRTLERVPAGTVFDFCVVLRVFQEDEEKDHLDLLLKGLKLLEQDALGGSGSRGYGRIKFFDLKRDGNPIDLKDVTL